MVNVRKNIEEILRGLTDLPHRGAATAGEAKAADFLEGKLAEAGYETERQTFRTSLTYIYEVWWMLLPMIGALLLLPVYPMPAFAVALFSGLSLILYFDWRRSWVMSMPPQGLSQNVIARPGGKGKARNKLILMGHYDSAPVSFLYLPSQVKNFAASLRFNLFNIAVAVILAALFAAGIENALLNGLRWIYVLYFSAQLVLSSMDFFRFGYTNGAADNASGAAAASAAFMELSGGLPADWDIELVLTGAEEVGMRGASHYFRAGKKDWEKEGLSVHLLNFDNVGEGELKIITRTGSIVPVIYDNSMSRCAVETAAGEERFSDIGTAEWHTGDFDSLPFARGGIPALTLSAQDGEGQIPNLHRPGDVYANVRLDLVEKASEFAVRVCQNLFAPRTSLARNRTRVLIPGRL